MHTSSGNFAQGVELCERGIEEEGPAPDDLVRCRLQILLSQCYWAQGNFQRALSVTEFPGPPSATLDVEVKVRLLIQRGFVLTQIGDYAQAKNMLEEAGSLAQRGQLEELAAAVQINFAIFHFCMGDYAAIEVAARSALPFVEREQLTPMMATAYASIGKSYMYRKREAEAIPWFERALAIYVLEGSDYYATSMRSELGCCYFALNEDDKAMVLFAEAIRKSEAAGGLTNQHIDLANIGCLHLRRGEYDAALAHFETALEIAQRLGDQLSVGKWLHNLAVTHSQMGNRVLAKNFQLEAELVNQKVADLRAAARRPPFSTPKGAFG